MKKGLLLFAAQAVHENAADPALLIELLNKASGDIQFDWGYLDDAEYVLTPDHVVASIGDRMIDQYDVVYFRFWGLPEVQSHALALARYCKLKNIPFVDEEVYRKGSYNKINQYLNLYEANVPFPATVICKAERVQMLATKYLSYPFVAKDARGTRGNDNFLVESSEQLADIIEQHAEKTFVLQRYIANQGDYRVFVTGDGAELIIYRRAKEGSYLNNTSQGAQAEIVAADSVSQAMLQDAVRAAKFFERDIAGVDMVLDEAGNHYCFEVNRAPQIEHSSFESEKASVIADYLLRRARNE